MDLVCKANTNIGNLKYDAGNFEEACIEYLQVLEKLPEDVDCLTNLGMALS